MDDHFGPNISIAPVVETDLRATSMPLDVHLVIGKPERYPGGFARAGADHILIHAEPSSTIHVRRAGCSRAFASSAGRPASC